MDAKRTICGAPLSEGLSISALTCERPKGHEGRHSNVHHPAEWSGQVIDEQPQEYLRDHTISVGWNEKGTRTESVYAVPFAGGYLVLEHTKPPIWWSKVIFENLYRRAT